MNSLQDCYRILDLEAGATIEEVKRSYRELVRVWHPDRFAHDQALQRKTQEKLKQINLAYERICKVAAEKPKANDANDEACASPRKAWSDDGEPQTSSPSESSPNEATVPQPPSQDFKERSPGSKLARFAMFLVGAFFVKLIVSALTHPTNHSGSYSPYIPVTPWPSTTPAAATPLPTTIPSLFLAKEKKQKEEPTLPKTQANDKTYTIGSSKAQVYTVQGTPKQMTDSNGT